MEPDLVAAYMYQVAILAADDEYGDDATDAASLVWNRMTEDQRTECRLRSSGLNAWGKNQRRLAEWALSTSTAPTSPTSGGLVSN